MGHRIDMYQHIDGFYSELGDTEPGKWRTGTAWLASGGKHGAIWCHAEGDPETNCATIMTNGTSTERSYFLQSHLLLGVYPTIPFPDNDHEILPHPRADEIYQEYGPLFHAMHGKRWSTIPHAVTIVSSNTAVSSTAVVNIFEMKPFGNECYGIAIVWSNTSVIDLSLNVGENKRYTAKKCNILHPGMVQKNIECQMTKTGSILNIPLVRGCAVVNVCV